MANTTGQKFGGRTKGTPNKCTSKSREVLSDLILGETDRIQEALIEVFESSKKDYLLIKARLLHYVIPKATEAPTKKPPEHKPLSWFTPS